MNKRQRKKKFKKEYGYNPPQSMPIHKAEQMAAVIEQHKEAWECLKNTLLEIAKALQPYFERMVISEYFTDTRFKEIEKLRQAWQQEHEKNEEAERIESSFSSDTKRRQ